MPVTKGRAVEAHVTSACSPGDRSGMTGPTADGAVQAFLERYPPRPYKQPDSPYPDAQLEQVGPADGLWYLNEVPHTAPGGSPRTVHEDDGENCHLWVIDERGRPCISQEPLDRLGGGKLHHTNLTGGGSASIGGEVWFGQPPRIYMSGSSGRYPPLHRKHLEDAERLFREVGFDVVSLGWNPETGEPRRVWRGHGQAAQE